MATKKTTKSTAKKTTVKRTTSKPVAKKAPTKTVEHNVYNTHVSVLLAMAVEALILLLGYLIIMSHVA